MNKVWIGKNIKIEFDRFGLSLKYLTGIIRIGLDWKISN